MVSIDVGPVPIIIYRNIFVMKFLYAMIREWLMEEGWYDLTGDNEERFLEKLYLEKRVGVKEIRAWWRTQKTPERGASDMYRYRMNVFLHVINMRDNEVVHEGRKVKAQYGEISIFIAPTLEFDPDAGLEKHSLLKYFFRYYRTRIMKKTLESKRRALIRDVYRLHGTIKKYLEERMFIPEMEVFHEKFEPAS